MRRVRLLLVLGFLGAAGCASQTPSPPPVSAPAPKPPPPMSAAPRPQPEDQCKAGQAMALIGHSRREIPVPVLPSLQRVACTTCPITMDYNPRRLNFFFDAETGLIKEVRCG